MAPFFVMKKIYSRKKVQNSWAFYDWANSVYPLVITTALFPVFYASSVVSDTGEGGRTDIVNFFGVEMINSVLYSFVVAASFLMVIALSPILSGMADYLGNKKLFLKLFCYLGAFSTMSLYFFDVDHLEVSMLSVFFASVGFWGSLVFYNSYLPLIATKDEQDGLSAKGFALGYLGSSILLITLLALLLSSVIEGFTVRHAFVITGLWWFGFSHVTYGKLPQDTPKEGGDVKGKVFKQGFIELKSVFNQVLQMKVLRRYLGAFFIYSMGIQTIMLMATLFAQKEIEGLPESGLIVSVLIIQFVAIGGSFLFSKSSEKLGNIVTIAIALVIWIACCVYAYVITTPVEFYILAGTVGLVMGGTQALSRSTYAKFLPKTQDTASFFSFFDVTEKVGIVIGMVIFGVVEQYYGNIRMSIIALIIFFVVGLFMLFRIPQTGSLAANSGKEGE